MGLAFQDEIEKAVMKAKKKLRDEEILEVLRKCSYGGKPISMDLREGGDLKYGKTNTGAVGKD